MKYDYLIIGCGLSGAVCGNILSENGKKVKIIEKRDFIGGNCYTEDVDGIMVHKYGAHIFRTNSDRVWNYVNKFSRFNNFINSPIANCNGRLFNLPFNMNTFVQLWGQKCSSPDDAKKIIESQCVKNEEPKNLEEYVLGLVGEDIYDKFIKEYTEKQWGRRCSELPKEIMKRIPIRYTFDNNYYNAKYQGVPEVGFTKMIEEMVSKCDVITGVDFNQNREKYKVEADKVIYTGPIDALYDYKFGKLKYRSLRFEHQKINVNNYQGVAVMNFTKKNVPYTRTIEHKHFLFGDDLPYTIISYEYPEEWKDNSEPFYPINDAENNNLFERYKEIAMKDGYILSGRLANYIYTDMTETIENAFELVDGMED